MRDQPLAHGRSGGYGDACTYLLRMGRLMTDQHTPSDAQHKIAGAKVRQALIDMYEEQDLEPRAFVVVAEMQPPYDSDRPGKTGSILHGYQYEILGLLEWARARARLAALRGAEPPAPKEPTEEPQPAPRRRWWQRG